MSELSSAVSIHPYFKVQEGKLDAFRETMKEFVARTSTEDTCLYYDFSVNGNVVFCREAYIGAAGVLKHLENVGSCIEEALASLSSFALSSTALLMNSTNSANP
ncbi:hypothetical protein OAE33_01750 [Akkermansiaceae bacterium]|nr:hypothetical protein [Akkermansiaceae bacterium]